MNSSFFQQQLRHVPNMGDDWFLTIDGYVEHPLTLSRAALLALPIVEQRCVISCAGHTPETPMLDEAYFRGVAMTTLLSRVVPKAPYINFHAADGYATSFPVESLTNALLITHMNGELLPPEHGFPARLWVPGRSGYKLPKWVQHVTVSQTSVEGFWEQRGWPTEGHATHQTTLQASAKHIKLGDAVHLSGVAYAGAASVQAVEICIEDGPWTSIPVPTHEPGALVAWDTTWHPPGPGHYRISARTASSAQTGTIITNHIVVQATL